MSTQNNKNNIIYIIIIIIIKGCAPSLLVPTWVQQQFNQQFLRAAQSIYAASSQLYILSQELHGDDLNH
jgi:hypothetical protein